MSTKRSPSDLRANGAALPEMAASFMSLPGFQVGQRIALEAARFSARRMRAYADQMEALAACDSPTAMMAVQSRFWQQFQEDYAAERAAVAEIVSAMRETETPGAQR